MFQTQQAAGSRQRAASRGPGAVSPCLCVSVVKETRRGFTLIDMLVTMTIIGILAAMVTGAVGMARQSIRADRTRATIAKLHNILMAKYDSYRTRRVPMDLRQYVWAHAQENTQSTLAKYYRPSAVGWPKELARARVNAIRDLMRLEMPDRWSDVGVAQSADHFPLVLRAPVVQANGDINSDLQWVPPVTQRYLRIHGAASDATDEWGAAECLYMIVTAIPEAADQFHASEIGDADGDGLPEFHDGWGRPIRFLRWPSGFYADPGNNFYGDGDMQFGSETLSGGVNPKYQADPFDPRRIISQQGFALFPLIYSAGPDGEFDINIGKSNSGASTYAYGLDASGNLDPFKADGDGNYVGQPYNNNGDPADPASFYRDLRHYDNIHNQRTEK